MAGKATSGFPSHFEWKVSVSIRMGDKTWAQAAFSVHRGNYPVHFVTHFTCIKKQHSLSSSRHPVGRECAREEPRVGIKARVKKPTEPEFSHLTITV